SVIGLDELPDQLGLADIVLSSTSSPHPIVGRDELELVMSQRERRPLLLIDIAVPRDIDPACGELEGVTLYDIDDLQAVVARNLNGDRGHASLELVRELFGLRQDEAAQPASEELAEVHDLRRRREG